MATVRDRPEYGVYDDLLARASQHRIDMRGRRRCLLGWEMEELKDVSDILLEHGS